MDILDVLKKEHREVSAMFEQAEGYEPGDSELPELARQIEAALTVHATLEEKLFYPVLRDRAEEQEQRVDVFEAFTEHDVAKHLIALLQSGRRQEERFKAQLQVLGENIRHHVKEEESTIFSLAQELLDDDEREAIGERWARAKQRLTAGGGARKAARGRKKSGTRKKTAATGRKKTGGRKKTRR